MMPSPLRIPDTTLGPAELDQVRDLTAIHFRDQPPERWPWWLGAIQEVQVSSVTPSGGAPTTRCPADIGILLELARRTFRLPGAIAECGVYRGATLVPLAAAVRSDAPEKPVLGLDSFQGLGHHIARDLALGAPANPDLHPDGFRDTCERLVADKVRRFGLEETVRLVSGFFRKSLERIAEYSFCFVHLDCDVYEAYRDCLAFFYPRLVPGGVLLIDEYDDPHWPGCTLAVDEFLADKPESLQPIVRGNRRKFYLTRAPLTTASS
jgi:hypothetical protein